MKFKMIFLLCFVSCFVSYTAAYTLARDKGAAWEETDKSNENTPDIEEIANREYATEMDRIIAVNLAHSMKPRDRTKRDNVFGEIERKNEQQHLNLFEGDILLDAELEKRIHNASSRVKRNALRSKKRLWTSRVIPYLLPSSMSYIYDNLQIAIKEFHDNTCLRFVPYDYIEKNYILFATDSGCASLVGKKYFEEGSQKLSLGEGCNFPGTIIHELMHTVGFYHEQSRTDRGQFVKIYWDNILDGFSSQFDSYSWLTIDDLGKDYDYQSIMHYSRTAFTKNGLPTIVNMFDESMEFGTPNKRLSQRDIIEINALYDCHTTTSLGWSSWSSFTPCDENCYKSRERFCYNSGNLQSCGVNADDYGIEKQTVFCPVGECPVPINGNWGRWSDGSECSVTCGDGLRTRFRKCDNPSPEHGGSACPGEDNVVDACTVRRCFLDGDDTDFETNMGMWWNSYGDDNLDWTRNYGYTYTLDTGPSNDHTFGDHLGYYLYVESSAPAQAGDSAKLVSPWMDPVFGGQCLKFFYNMYGSTVGDLRVQIDLQGGTSYLLFYEYGDKGNVWRSAMKDIDTTVPYKLTFDARIGSVGYSDIAIDDVYIDPGFCDCQDKHYTACPTWASEGECQTNQPWMNDFCPRSCDACSTTAAVCSDVETIYCPLWAIQDECTSNAGYMMQNCQKSCAVCGCNDDDVVNCPGWAVYGYCDSNPDYMLAHCQKSCLVCGCEDRSPHCGSWAQSGECDKNPGYMLTECCKSCRNMP